MQRLKDSLNHQSFTSPSILQGGFTVHRARTLKGNETMLTEAKTCVTM